MRCRSTHTQYMLYVCMLSIALFFFTSVVSRSVYCSSSCFPLCLWGFTCSVLCFPPFLRGARSLFLSSSCSLFCPLSSLLFFLLIPSRAVDRLTHHTYDTTTVCLTNNMKSVGSVHSLEIHTYICRHTHINSLSLSPAPAYTCANIHT